MDTLFKDVHLTFEGQIKNLEQELKEERGRSSYLGDRKNALSRQISVEDKNRSFSLLPAHGERKREDEIAELVSKTY